MQRSSKVSRCIPEEQTSIWTRPAAESLIGIIFRFREHQMALSAEIEAMILQVAVPNEDGRCLRFLWREDPEQRIEV